MPRLLDQRKNFAVMVVQGYYDAEDTQITVDDATRATDLESSDPDFGYNAVWYNDTAYPGAPEDDPDREIVRVVSQTGNVLTLKNAAGVREAQEGTVAKAHDTPGATYKLVVGWTAKDLDDLETKILDVGDAWALLSEYGTGDGVADDKGAFDAAIAGGVKFLVIPAGTWRVGSDLTIGNTVTLNPLPGALVVPDSTKTLTVQGDVIAGNYQWHSESSGGTVNLSGSRCSLRRKRWDGTDSDEVEVAGADISIRGARVSFANAQPASGTWAVGDIVLNSEPSAAEPLGWRCTSAGTPGTWETLSMGGVDGLSFANAAPGSGTYATGDIVLNSEPAADEPVGWRCTSGGTPGTWKAFGYAEDATYIGINGKKFKFDTAAPGSGTWAVGDTVINSNPSTDAPIGWRCTGAGTPGTWETLRKGTQLKTYTSSAFDPDTPWNAATEYTYSFAHGEGTPPSIDDLIACTFVHVSGSPATFLGARAFYVKSIDATNINIYVYPNSVPASTTVRFQVTFRVP